jgi:endoglucanase
VAGAGSKRLEAFTLWAAAHGARGFLGEFAVGDPAIPSQEQCRAELRPLLDHVEKNRGQWAGWSAWGAGVRWPTSHIFRLEPADAAGPDTNVMKALLPYLR